MTEQNTEKQTREAAKYLFVTEDKNTKATAIHVLDSKKEAAKFMYDNAKTHEFKLKWKGAPVQTEEEVRIKFV